MMQREREREERPTTLASLAKFCQGYVGLVSQVPEVSKVLLVHDGDIPCLITLIEDAPFSREARYRVYEAQGQMMENVQELLVDFRVINVSELDVSLSMVIPPTSMVLFERDQA